MQKGSSRPSARTRIAQSPHRRCRPRVGAPGIGLAANRACQPPCALSARPCCRSYPSGRIRYSFLHPMECQALEAGRHTHTQTRKHRHTRTHTRARAAVAAVSGARAAAPSVYCSLQSRLNVTGAVVRRTCSESTVNRDARGYFKGASVGPRMAMGKQRRRPTFGSRSVPYLEYPPEERNSLRHLRGRGASLGRQWCMVVRQICCQPRGSQIRSDGCTRCKAMQRPAPLPLPPLILPLHQFGDDEVADTGI